MGIPERIDILAIAISKYSKPSQPRYVLNNEQKQHMAEYHAVWQRDNREHVNEYKRERRRQARAAQEAREAQTRQLFSDLRSNLKEVINEK